MMSIFFRTTLIVILLGFAKQGLAADLTVYDVRVGAQGANTRLVIESSTPVNVTVADGDQARIELGPFTYTGKTPTASPVTHIQDIRVDSAAGVVTARFPGPVKLVQKLSLPSFSHSGAKRLVFDFTIGRAYSGNYYINNYTDSGGRVLDPPKTLGRLNSHPAPPPVTTASTAQPHFTPAADPEPLPVPASSVVSVERHTYKPLTVVVDAGHGGKDPGTQSPSGLREKDITLATALALRDELQRRGHTVYLTRSTDIFIPLRGRVDIARRHKADLFISVHADSMGNGSRTTQGASVYTLSDVSSDAETAKLAARENQADIIGGIDLSHEDKDVANILIDLAMRDTMNQSKKLANTLVMEFNDNNLPMLSPAHRFAGFAVLKAADVPSILIELGFLSSPEEAAHLNDSSYRTRLARSISDTVDIYAEKYRPREQ